MSKNEYRDYYCVISAEVLNDERIPDGAKILYGEINALCHSEGYCFATNEYFSKRRKKSKWTVTQWINLLVEYGYIKREMIYDADKKSIKERRLYVEDNTPKQFEKSNEGSEKNQTEVLRKNKLPSMEKSKYPTVKNLTDNNTVNITSNNTINITPKDNSYSKEDFKIPSESVLEKYNDKLKLEKMRETLNIPSWLDLGDDFFELTANDKKARLSVRKRDKLDELKRHAGGFGIYPEVCDELAKECLEKHGADPKWIDEEITGVKR